MCTMDTLLTYTYSYTYSCSSVASFLSFPSFQCRRPANDLGNLLRNLRLPCPVICARQSIENVAGVVGCVFHRGAARAVLGRGGLDERTIDAVADVQRQQAVEDLVGGWREDIVVLVPCLAFRFRRGRCDGQDAHGRGRRRERGAELRVDDVHLVEVASLERLAEWIDQSRGIGDGRAVRNVGALGRELRLLEAKEADALAADDVQVDSDVLSLQASDEAARLADQVDIE